jgi:hypothetical protein
MIDVRNNGIEASIPVILNASIIRQYKLIILIHVQIVVMPSGMQQKYSTA